MEETDTIARNGTLPLPAAPATAPALLPLLPWKPLAAMSPGELLAELATLRVRRHALIENLPANKRKRRKLTTFTKRFDQLVEWIAAQSEGDRIVVIAALQARVTEERQREECCEEDRER